MKRRLRTIILALLILLPTLPLQALAAKGVVLNFTDVDISTMVKFISDLTGRNFVMDERVKGKISVYSPAKLSPDDAFNVFTSVLELKGFTLVQAGRVNKIVPAGAAKQLGTRIFSDSEKGPVNETYVARVITLENITPQEAVTFLQPLVSKDGHIAPFGPANMLLVVDSALNIRKLLEIVELIDTEKPREKAELLFLQHASADTLSKVVQEWLGGRAGKAPTLPGQTAPATGGLVVADVRLNALVVFGSDKDKEEVKRFVALLDVPPPTASSKVNVYYLENADATEVAKVLDGVVKGSTAAAVPGQPAGSPQQSPFEGGKITITPDKATNSLVVMASPNDYQNLLQVIQKLDKRRRQVFVQALIAEVSLDRAKELGVQWGFVGGGSNGTVSTAGVYDPFGTLTPLLAALSQLSQAGITNPELSLASPANFPAVLKALQTNGLLNVLSNPTILTSDNKEAEIFVGENIPFLGQSSLTSTGLSQQSIERKDTGITLKLTPQVSEGDYVKLDLYQEISALKDTVAIGANATDRTTTKRSAKTSVVVKNQETVAIGGLIQETDQDTVSKVPILGDIPILGWLFKTKSTKRNKTNLMILLTPRVIRDARDLAEVSERQKEKLDEAIKRTEPLDIPAALKQKDTKPL